MALSRKQKADIAAALIREAGTLAEFWTEKGLSDIPCDEGVAYLASLMRKMPGDAWDKRLGKPDAPKAK